MNFAAGVLPAVGRAAEMLEPDGGVSVDLESGLADAFTEGKVFAEVPVAALVIFHHRLKPRCHRFAEHRVADWQIELALYVQIHLPPDKKETGGSVHDLQHSAVAAELHLAGLRQELARKLSVAFFYAESCDDGQWMTPQSFYVIRVEADALGDD